MPETETTITQEAPSASEQPASQESEISTGEKFRTIEDTFQKGALLSVEGFIMMSVAAAVDGGELLFELIPGIGTAISILIDIFALLFIGGWMYFRSGQITVPKKTGDRIAKVGAKAAKWAKHLKWLRPLCFIIEMIPIGSSILPLWILVVYAELKSGEG